MIDDYSPYFRLWDSVIQFQELKKEWHSNPLCTVDADKVEAQIEAWFKDCFKMIKQFDTEQLRGVQKVAKGLKQGIEDFRIRFPFLKAFGCDAWGVQVVLPRHWDTLFQRMDIQKPSDYDKISLQMM